jgi:hypothetical protein
MASSRVHPTALKPLLEPPRCRRNYPEYETERKKREEELKTFRETKFGEVLANCVRRASEYMLGCGRRKNGRQRQTRCLCQRTETASHRRPALDEFLRRCGAKWKRSELLALFAFVNVTNYEAEATAFLKNCVLRTET